MAENEAAGDAAALRRLDLDPERAGRAARAPYAIVDIGSNSVRLIVYDQLGRAPMPRFNEKSLCRLGEGLAQTGAIAPDGFRRTVEAARRFRAIAEAMGVTKIDATATEAMRRASNGPALAAAIAAESGLEVRILSGAEEARFAALGVISGFFRPVGSVGDMGGGSLEVAEALDDRVGERWVSLPLGALPVEAMLAEGLPEAKRRIDAMLQENLPPALDGRSSIAVGGGWRCDRQGAYGGDRRAGQSGARLYARDGRGARASPNRCCALRRPSSPRRPACPSGARAPCRRRRWCSIAC